VGTRGRTNVTGPQLQSIFRLDSTYMTFTSISSAPGAPPPSGPSSGGASPLASAAPQIRGMVRHFFLAVAGEALSAAHVVPPGMPGPLLAVDAPFLLYRSFFALPDSIHGLDGHSVNALLGAANALLRIAADRRPRAIVICFGAEAAEYRTALYPSYHASRPPVPDPLAWQFEQAPAFFESFGWAVEGSDDLEADDLLG